MNYSIAERHLMLAHHAQFSRNMHTGTLEKSNHHVWTEPGYSESSREQLDFEDGFSGDDLARLRVDESRIVKHIGNQSGLWSDVRRGAEAVAA